LVLLVCMSCLICAAAPLKVGDAVPSIQAKDQFGVSYTFTNGTRFLLVAVEMNAAKSSNRKLSDQGKGFLEMHGAVYLMDIHPMPSIARMFAFPKMRKYPQRIILMDSENALAWVPVKPGCLTVMALTPDGHIRAISYWNPETNPVATVFD